MATQFERRHLPDKAGFHQRISGRPDQTAGADSFLLLEDDPGDGSSHLLLESDAGAGTDALLLQDA